MRFCTYFGCRVGSYEADDYWGQGCPVCGHVGEPAEPNEQEPGVSE